jgi:hypothetical protein
VDVEAIFIILERTLLYRVNACRRNYAKCCDFLWHRHGSQSILTVKVDFYGLYCWPLSCSSTDGLTFFVDSLNKIDAALNLLAPETILNHVH